MGGIHSDGLAEDVGYMIVGNRKTSKYQHAVRTRGDIVFLRPSFVPDLVEKWMQGEDIDLKAELERGKLGVFEGLKLCLTNIHRDFRRDVLIDIITTHGGEHAANLTRSVTHLITPCNKGNKCHYAKHWDIPIVRAEWVTASVERGAALAESYFHVDLDDDKIGVGAFEGTSKRSPVYVDEEVPLPRPASKRVSSNAIWDSILGDLDRPAKGKSAAMQLSAWDDADRDHTDDGYPLEKSRRRKTLTKSEQVEEAAKGLFSGQVFDFVGFDQKQRRTLEKVVASHNGEISTQSHSDTTTIIVNSAMDPLDKPNFRSSDITIVTEWAVERSMHKHELLLDVWGTFVEHRNIPEFRGLKVSLSGFSGIELLHLDRLLAMLGATFQPVFSRDGDLLISTKKSSKFKYALQWDIPIVNELWLWECALQGRMVPLDSKIWVLDGKESESRVLVRRNQNVVEQRSSALASVVEDGVAIQKRSRSDRMEIESEEKKPKDRRLVGRATVSVSSTCVSYVWIYTDHRIYSMRLDHLGLPRRSWTNPWPVK
jgi:DNA replication regulator DPB11